MVGISRTMLCAWVKNKVGCGYVYGAAGQICTEALLRECHSRLASVMGAGYYEKDGNFKKGRCAKWLGNLVYDCSGLVKCARLGLGGVWADVSAQGTYDQCAKRGTMAGFPSVAGTLVFMWSAAKKRMGHVGVYVGDGLVVEARGVDWGVVTTKLANRAWTHWGIPDWLTGTDGARSDGAKASDPAKADADAGDATTAKPGDRADEITATVNAAIIHHGITSASHWEAALRGTVPLNPAYVLQMMKNFNAEIDRLEGDN